MNCFYFKKNQFINLLLNNIEFKAKLKLTYNELFKLFAKYPIYLNCLVKNYKGKIVLNEIEYENIIRASLQLVGYSKRKSPHQLLINDVIKKYPELEKRYEVAADFVNFLSKNSSTKNFDLSDFLFDSSLKYGPRYAGYISDLIQEVFNSVYESPCYKLSKYKNIEVVDLNDLFCNNKINKITGTFFDQRYIDFLEKNITVLDTIHWRKFEELIAEFLKREGFDVKLCKGVKDNGKDIVIINNNKVIFIQCKNYKKNIGIETIKQLDYEISHDNCHYAILACSHDVTRESKRLIDNDKLKIGVINIDTIKKFLCKYRTKM